MAYGNSYKYHEKIAIAIFVILIFFEFFGTSIPFQPRIKDVAEIESSNILNQIIYSFLFLVSCYVLILNWKSFIELITKEKFLTIFLLWCLLTMAWSIDPFVTLKRLFRIITFFTVSSSFLLSVSSNKEILRYFKGVLYLYVFISIVSCLVIPGAIDPQFHTWRGLTSQKNDLGQVSLACILLSFFIYQNESGYSKIIAAISTFASISLLFGSMSVTSIISFMFLIMIGILFKIDSLFEPIGLRRTVSALIIFFVIGITATFILFSSNIFRELTNLVGKDITFSGRTDLWLAMLNEISNHFYLGAGFQSFWSLSNPKVLNLYQIFVWLPNQAHNGYIDVLNEVGLVGFILFLSLIINYFIGSAKLKISDNPWKWFIVIALIVNLQESTFFRPGHILGGMLMFSYLVLFRQLLLQEEEDLYMDDEQLEAVNEEQSL